MYNALNPSQLEAVLCIDAPSLVIAGAGSGKTRVLTYKIAYLLEQGLQPWNILALTFTNKAAREMRDRIASLVSPEKAAGLWMGTFHSIFARILRMEADRLGYDPNYTIYDANDSLSLVKLIIRDMGLDEKVYKPTAVQNRISNAKNRLILPSGYGSVREFRENDMMHNRPEMPEIYRRYQERAKQSNAMDFDDLLLNTWLLLKNNPDVAQKYQERFHFVLVDEYQDTNYAQHQIVWLLTNQRQRVCVVGDDAQSIYSFRGAEIDNILRFQETYPGTRLFKLEQNYRSTQTIVNAANSLIHNNQEQIQKHVFSEKEVGRPIALCQAYSDIDEANIVLREVQNAHRAGIPYSGVAILYRTNAQSRKIEDALLHGRVPYHIYAGMSFYQREEIKDMLCYLRLTANPRDEESLRRVINKPARGIGDTTVRKLLAAAASAGVSAWEILEQGTCPDVNAGTQKKLTAFHDMIAAFHSRATEEDACTLALHVVKESGLQQVIFSGHEPEDVSRQENLQEMLDGISAFVSDNQEQGLGVLVTDYLQQASLATDQDLNQQDEDADCVTMMTVHAAKGLEFPVVFIVGMEEGLFPSDMSQESPRALEEERRLFYVALTRAEKQVVLTYAKSRFRFGQMEYSSPSRFIREIPAQYYGSLTPDPSPRRGERSGSFSSLKPVSSSQGRTGGDFMSRIKPLSPKGGSTTNPPSPRNGIGGEATGAEASPTRRLKPLSSLRNPLPSPRSEAGGEAVLPSPRRGVGGEASISPGTVVVHERFGRGTVQHIEGTGIDARATVAFDNAGTKVLMLRFAKLTVQ